MRIASFFRANSWQHRLNHLNKPELEKGGGLRGCVLVAATVEFVFALHLTDSPVMVTGLAEGGDNANLRLNARGESRPRGGVKDEAGPCRYAVCLTQAQLISVAVITTLIIIVVLSISLVALRRQNQFKRNELLATVKKVSYFEHPSEDCSVMQILPNYSTVLSINLSATA